MRILRRRFRPFSLRTQMVLVGVAGLLFAWLASEWRFAMERRSAREAWARDSGVIVETGVVTIPGSLNPPSAPAKISLVRMLFGDEPVERVVLMGGEAKVDLATAKRLFPEARVAEYVP